MLPRRMSVFSPAAEIVTTLRGYDAYEVFGVLPTLLTILAGMEGFEPVLRDSASFTTCLDHE